MKRILLFISLMLAVVGVGMAQDVLIVTDGQLTVQCSDGNGGTVDVVLTLYFDSSYWEIVDITCSGNADLSSYKLVIPDCNLAGNDNYGGNGSGPISGFYVDEDFSSYFVSSNFASITLPPSLTVFEADNETSVKNSIIKLPSQTIYFKSADAPTIQYGDDYQSVSFTNADDFGGKTFYVPSEAAKSAYEEIFGDAEGLTIEVAPFTLPAAITINHNEPYIYPVGGTADVTYVRPVYGVQRDKWQALFIPFDIPATDMSSLQVNGSTITVAELYGATTTNGEEVLQWRTVSSVEAGKPYIIKFNNYNSDFSAQFDDATVKGKDDVTPTEVSSTNYTYTITGTYEGIEAGEGPTHWYALHDGNFYHAGPNATLPPNRIYLTITNAQGEPSPAPANMKVMVDGEVVGILEHFFDPELLIDDNYYDVLGRRIDNPQAGQLYIHQGKKIIYSE